jgi:hypothetical protein
MFGQNCPHPGTLPARVEAVFIEGLRDPAGLKGIRWGAVRDQWDVELALRLYPWKVVKELYPGNFEA